MDLTPWRGGLRQPQFQYWERAPPFGTGAPLGRADAFPLGGGAGSGSEPGGSGGAAAYGGGGSFAVRRARC